ncbi:MAG: SRPBCC family protein [Planctomycetota bacterium]
MPSFRVTETIERPADVVFHFLEDTRNVPLWLNGVVRIEPLDDGPMRAGWRFKETRRMGKREVSAVIEVRVHEGPGPGKCPPYRHTAGASMMGVDAIFAFTFDALDARRTKAEAVGEVRPTNVFGRLFAGMVVRMMQKQDGDMLARMKRAVEGR